MMTSSETDRQEQSAAKIDMEAVSRGITWRGRSDTLAENFTGRNSMRKFWTVLAALADAEPDQLRLQRDPDH